MPATRPDPASLRVGAGGVSWCIADRVSSGKPTSRGRVLHPTVSHMTADTARPMIRLDVAPSRAPMDAEITVRILGASPGGQVTVSCRSTDAAGQRWQSAAAFTADQSGTVDLRRDRPLPGSSYTGIDPMGLVWPMRPAGTPDPQAARDPLAPQRLVILAQADGTSQATAEVSRLFVPDGLTRTEYASAA